MYDPLGGFYRIREQYLAYLETAFRIADPLISAERRELLQRPGQLCTEPLFEPMARYRSVDWQLDEMTSVEPSPTPGFDKESRSLFAELIKRGLFPNGGISIYEHQAEMLRRGTQTGEPGIVTSGTGSGKTEAFLLPVVAALVNEARYWPAPAPDYLKSRWWHRPDGRPYDKYTEIPKDSRPLKANPDADRSCRIALARIGRQRCVVSSFTR
jgi:DEAD/DEAH box helicase domain-containing protein